MLRAQVLLRRGALLMLLGAVWGIRLILRHQQEKAQVTLSAPELLALQKEQEREERTNRWISELEQDLSDKTDDQ